MPPYGRRRKLFNWEDTDWCGSGRSDGKWQSNSCGFATARSRYDQACKDHDCNLARGMDTSKADLEFARNVDNPFIGYAPFFYHKINNMFTPASSTRMVPRAAPRTGLNYNGRSSYKHVASGTSSIQKVGEHKFKRAGNRKTVSFFYENGGVVEEIPVNGLRISQVLYVGHSTYNRVKEATALWSAIVKKLFEKSGIDVPNLEVDIMPPGNGVFSVNVKWVDSTTDLMQNYSFNGNNLLEIINAFVSYFDTEHYLQFKSIELNTVGADNGDVPSFTFMAKLDLERVVIHMFNKSHIQLQNTTSSSTGSEELDVIGTNPLKFRKYYVNRANFAVSNLSTDPDPIQGLTSLGKPSLSSGLIAFFSEDTALSVDQKDYFSSPPRPELIDHCSGVQTGIVHPNGIIHSDCVYKSSYYMSTFYDILRASIVANQTSEFGRCEVFALEKFIDSRFEANAPTVTYQVQHTYVASLSFKKTAPTATVKEVQKEVYIVT